MSTLLFLLIGSCCLVGGYFFYGRFIARRVGLRPDRPTPAHARKGMALIYSRQPLGVVWASFRLYRWGRSNYWADCRLPIWLATSHALGPLGRHFHRGCP